LESEPLFALLVLAAAKMDEDLKKGLLPSELSNIDAVSKRFGGLVSEATKSAGIPPAPKVTYDSVDLPPFTKYVLINLVSSASKEKLKSLK
jgi:hypothetical protein